MKVSNFCILSGELQKPGGAGQLNIEQQNKEPQNHEVITSIFCGLRTM
jgi:hypothetical protein